MQVLILGAGPAGLAAAYRLAEQGSEVCVLEKNNRVGGICRTLCYKGYYFDLGGHRFFTKYDEVFDLWQEILGEDFLLRPRLSRIFYKKRLFDYPLKASNALMNLGPVEAARCMASYARARLRNRGQEENLEQWVSNRFGDRLFEIFFKTYTEKVWGIPTTEIGADWASQRIKNMELSTVVKKAFLAAMPSQASPREGEVVTSLIEQFHYPRTGPGLMYDTMGARTTELGGEILTEHTATRLEWEESASGSRRVTRVHALDPEGSEISYEAEHVISSMPLTLLIRGLEPRVPEKVWEAAHALTFRNLLTIDLIVDHPDLFPDNWIYVHDPDLALGRVQNFKNWSPEMVPDPSKTSLGLEYFCWDDDALWTSSEEELIALGTREIKETGLLKGASIEDGTIVRVPKAYPVYRKGYEKHLDTLVEFLKGFENLHPIGRYGMFKYNNADHSILTALLTVENIHGAAHDVWAVNTDTDYQEVRRETGS